MNIKIALAGNPNSGKTTLFNALTGSNQFVGNWPGVTVEKKEGILKDYLQKNEKQNKVYISDKKQADSKEIATKYKVLSSKNGLSLIEIELLTGRTHQIRAHMSSLGHPLLGDGKYGTNEQKKKFPLGEFLKILYFFEVQLSIFYILQTLY